MSVISQVVADEAKTASEYGGWVALLSGLTALVSIAITSLRKRKDVSVEEMQSRIKSLEEENTGLNGDLAASQDLALARARYLFVLRNTLAEKGIPDPTVKDPE